MRFPALLTVLVSALAAAGAEDRPGYVLTLKTETTSVGLGEDIQFRITLEKRRGKPVEVNALRLARDSVSLLVRVGERDHELTRTYASVEIGQAGAPFVRAHRPPRASLKRGKPLVLALPVMAVVAGEIEFRAIYRGLPGPTRRVNSEPVTMKVTRPEGKSEVAAVLTTSLGSMLLRFRADRLLNTVWNFLSLVRDGRYDGLTIHRIVRDALVQGGDPKGNGTGGPGWFIPEEWDPEVRHVRGAISMAHAPGLRDTAGSQFFMLLSDRKDLDGEYAAFGWVDEGVEVLDKIGMVETMEAAKTRPRVPVAIRSIRVVLR